MSYPKTQVSLAKEPYKTDLYSTKETHIFKEPTHHSYTITKLSDLQESSRNVTKCHEMSRNVTKCHEMSRNVDIV